MNEKEIKESKETDEVKENKEIKDTMGLKGIPYFINEPITKQEEDFLGSRFYADVLEGEDEEDNDNDDDEASENEEDTFEFDEFEEEDDDDDLDLFEEDDDEGDIDNDNVEAAGVKQITVMNALGQVVYSIPAEGENAMVDLSRLESGMYLLRIETEIGSEVRQICVVK